MRPRFQAIGTDVFGCKMIPARNTPPPVEPFRNSGRSLAPPRVTSDFQPDCARRNHFCFPISGSQDRVVVENQAGHRSTGATPSAAASFCTVFFCGRQVRLSIIEIAGWPMPTFSASSTWVMPVAAMRSRSRSANVLSWRSGLRPWRRLAKAPNDLRIGMPANTFCAGGQIVDRVVAYIDTAFPEEGTMALEENSAAAEVAASAVATAPEGASA